MTSRARWLVAGLAAALLVVPLPVLAVDDYGDEPTALPTAIAASAPAEPAIALDPVEDELYGVASVVPEGWQPFGNGVYARGTPPTDLTLIALQSAPGGPDDVWTALLPQLGLPEVPEATEARRTDAFDWTLYALEAEAPSGTLAVEVALAEEGGTTYIVLLQADPDEVAALREGVFLPAIDAFELLEPEPTRDPATLGYAAEEVRFPGGSEGVELAGTLTLPGGEGPHPVVVLMSGSGPQDRDESLRPVSAIKPFALIADALTLAGLGVLRYDDRGVGGSTGDYEAATVAELAGDGRAALDFLATRADVDPERLGVLGHSEGAIYAATIAAEDPRVAFAIVMAPPAVDGVQLLIDQGEAIARASGLPAEEVAATVAFGEEAYPAARDGDAALVEKIIRSTFGAYWDRQTDEIRAALGEREGFIQRQVDLQLETLTSDWFRSVLASDPAADWARVTVPVLALFGGRDVQVPLEPNGAALRDALEQAGNDDVTIVTIPDANHLFQASETGALEEYGRLAETFGADVLPTLVEWTTERAGVSGGAPSPNP